MFPSTRRLDKFNRADGALGDDWAALAALGADMPNVLDEAAVGGDGYKGATWTADTFGSDQECYMLVRFAASAGIFFGIFVRLTGDDGYQLSFDPIEGELNLSRVDDGVATPLASTEYNLGDGHILGLRAVGSTLTGWVYAAGTWNLVFTETDATYSSGAIGWHCYDLDAPDLVLDDFGGGDVGAAGDAPENTAAPSLVGVAETGNTLVCDPGSWSGDETISFDYQWQADGHDIAGEESDELELIEGLEGASVRCRVTGWNASGVADAFTAAVEPIASTAGLDDTLVRVSGEWLPSDRQVRVGGEWL